MSGEHPNGRKAIQGLIKHMVSTGMSGEQATAKAKEVARRHDRKNKK